MISPLVKTVCTIVYLTLECCEFGRDYVSASCWHEWQEEKEEHSVVEVERMMKLGSTPHRPAVVEVGTVAAV